MTTDNHSPKENDSKSLVEFSPEDNLKTLKDIQGYPLRDNHSPKENLPNFARSPEDTLDKFYPQYECKSCNKLFYINQIILMFDYRMGIMVGRCHPCWQKERRYRDQ